MNIVNSRALLLYIFVCLFAFVGQAEVTHSGDKKSSKKDIVIVNIDSSLDDQVASIADYAADLFNSKAEATINITRYVTNPGDKKVVDDLIKELTILGVAADKIVVKDEALRLDTPYFSLTISSGKDVQ